VFHKDSSKRLELCPFWEGIEVHVGKTEEWYFDLRGIADH
jgi:hypothetical protein